MLTSVEPFFSCPMHPAEPSGPGSLIIALIICIKNDKITMRSYLVVFFVVFLHVVSAIQACEMTSVIFCAAVDSP
jgi:hypothetical protein